MKGWIVCLPILNRSSFLYVDNKYKPVPKKVNARIFEDKMVAKAEASRWIGAVVSKAD